MRKRIGEFEMIAHYLAPLAHGAGAAQLSDDAAVLSPPPGQDLVVSKDMLAGGVHFFLEDPPRAIARKALRVNLSDLAAKGATPLGYFLGLGLTGPVEETWIDDFAQGLAADQAEFGIDLFGGDTIAGLSQPLLSVTVVGALPVGTIVRRAGAQPGDIIYLSGTVGDAALGLSLRTNGWASQKLADLAEPARHFLLDRYLIPQPRVDLAEAVRRYATAALDISDGLAADLAHLCATSDVGAEVDLARLPLSPAATVALQQASNLMETVVAGGDDYEIL